MWFNLDGAISTLSNKPLKLQVQFNTLVATSHRLKMKSTYASWSYLQIINYMEIWSTDKITWNLFQAVAVSILQNWRTTKKLTKYIKKKLDRELFKIAIYCFEQILEGTPHEIAVLRPLTSHLINHHSKTKSHAVYFLRSKDELRRDVFLLCSTFTSSSLQCWPISRHLHTSILCRQWMQFRRPTSSDCHQEWMERERERERESGNSGLTARPDNNCLKIIIVDIIAFQKTLQLQQGTDSEREPGNSVSICLTR